MIAYITELNSDNWETFKSGELVLVDVWAPWCGPCKMVSPIVDEISNKFHGQLSVGKLEADGNRDIVGELSVRNIPTILIFKNGVEVERKVGVTKLEELSELIEQQLS